MGHLVAEIHNLEEKIVAEKLKLHLAIRQDEPLHVAKAILHQVRMLERKRVELKIQQEKEAE